MKIMFYINSIDYGGAERVISNLSSLFADTGYESVLVTSYYSEHEYVLPPTVRRLSLEWEEVQQSRIKRNLSRIKKLRALCKKERPDILVSFMKEPNFRSVIATMGLGIKTIVSVRNDPNVEYKGKEGRFVGKVLLPMAHGCVFQTEEAKKWFPKRLQRKSKIIYNSVKEEFYHIERKPNKGEIVTLGRLAGQKNHSLLIDAFAEVAKRIPYATLKIYGEGPLEETLKKKIEEYGLSSRIMLPGTTSDVAGALESADLFVLSSDFEGMPNALMEAMAVGVPSFSTDCPCGGPRELFGKELSSQLFKVGDKEELSRKIAGFFDSGDEERKALSEKCKAVADGFRPSRINKEWVDYVSSVATGSLSHKSRS